MSDCGYDYKCKFCNLQWRDEEAHRAHVDELHPSCPHCAKVFKHSEALGQHLKDSYCGHVYECQFCNLVWCDEEAHRAHMYELHPFCPCCAKAVKDGEAWVQHLLRDSSCGRFPYECGVCGYLWRDEEVDNAHIAIPHPTCTYCAQVFKDQKALQTHLKDSDCGYDYKCKFCNLQWRDEEAHRAHVDELHVSCPHCAKAFKHSDALGQHLRDSFCGCGYRYKCGVCGLECRDEKALKEHKLSHATSNKLLRLRPSDIRFSHDTISSRFSCGRPVHATLAELVLGQIGVEDLPRMLVTWKDGKLWAFTGNRRLYVFRALEALGRLDHIWLEVTQKSLSKRKWTTKNDGLSVQLRP